MTTTNASRYERYSYFLVLIIIYNFIILSSAFSSVVDTRKSASKSTIMNESVETDSSHRRRRYYSPFLAYNDDSNNTTTKSSASMIILNTPIPNIDNSTTANNVFQILWNSSSFHVCADGGANRLYDATRTSITTTVVTDKDPYLPDMITGDLDSLRADVRTYYEERGVKIVQVVDQDYHDLDKSLMMVEEWLIGSQTTNNHEQDSSTISNDDTTMTYKTFIYGGFGGRFDQEMACINTLYSWGCHKESFRLTQMSIWNEETGVILLPEDPVLNEIMICFPGLHDDTDDKVEQTDKECTIIGEGPTCGLIPIAGRCEKVYTTGLKWNLNGDMPLEFGGLVSSSNRIVERVVTVRTSSPLLFSFEIVRRCLSR